MVERIPHLPFIFFYSMLSFLLNISFCFIHSFLNWYQLIVSNCCCNIHFRFEIFPSDEHIVPTSQSTYFRREKFHRNGRKIFIFNSATHNTLTHSYWTCSTPCNLRHCACQPPSLSELCGCGHYIRRVPCEFSRESLCVCVLAHSRACMDVVSVHSFCINKNVVWHT